MRKIEVIAPGYYSRKDGNSYNDNIRNKRRNLSVLFTTPQTSKRILITSIRSEASIRSEHCRQNCYSDS